MVETKQRLNPRSILVTQFPNVVLPIDTSHPLSRQTLVILWDQMQGSNKLRPFFPLVSAVGTSINDTIYHVGAIVLTLKRVVDDALLAD